MGRLRPGQAGEAQCSRVGGMACGRHCRLQQLTMGWRMTVPSGKMSPPAAGPPLPHGRCTPPLQANLLFVKELARRLKEEGSAVEAFALHPGEAVG